MKTANELSLTLLSVIDDVISNKVTMEKAAAVTRLADKYTKNESMILQREKFIHKMTGNNSTTSTNG